MILGMWSWLCQKSKLIGWYLNNYNIWSFLSRIQHYYFCIVRYNKYLFYGFLQVRPGPYLLGLTLLCYAKAIPLIPIKQTSQCRVLHICSCKSPKPALPCTIFGLNLRRKHDLKKKYKTEILINHFTITHFIYFNMIEFI